MRLRRIGLFNNTEFIKLWTAQAVSQFGSRITREGLALTAVLVLAASPAEMGVLGALSAAPVLLFGLLAGVWVDRLRRRPILIATDLGRALVLATVPLAAWLGVLRVEQLYVVALIAGTLTVFFNVADQSYLPSVVGRDQLLDANSKLGATESVAEIGGPALAGILIQALTAPIAIVFDALSFVVSAVFIGLVRAPDPRPVADPNPPSVWQDMRAGLHVILSQPTLRSLALTAGMRTFFGSFIGALYGLYAVRELGVSPAVLGLLVGLGGVGSLLGAVVAGWAARRLGVGVALVGGAVLSACLTLLLPLASGPMVVVVAMLAIPQLFGDMAMTVFMINEVSLRQTLIPDHLLGRANASMHFLVGALGPVGALVGGALATGIGARATLLIAALGILAAALGLLASPVRALRAEPAAGV